MPTRACLHPAATAPPSPLVDELIGGEAFFAGERVCPPPDVEREPVNPIPLIYAGFAAAIAFGWFVVAEPLRTRETKADVATAISATPSIDPVAASPAAIDQSFQTVDVASTKTDAALAAAPELAQSEAVETVAPLTQSDEATPVKLPEPVADPSNPLQKRALAVGLHPDVSAALLKRMSKTDFKNAGLAIKTALLKTPFGDVLSYPDAPGSDQALFEIKFVRGSSDDCRRYVVTVTKDRWSTTAPAMEKCGTAAALARNATG